MVLSPSHETNSSNFPVDFDGVNDIVVPASKRRQLCDDDFDVYGSYAEKETMIDGGSKEPKFLFYEDDTVAGEMTRSDEKFFSESETENDDGMINDKVQALKGDKNETSKAYKSMVLSPSNKSNIHITAVGGRSQGQNCLLHEDGFGIEETKKSNEQLEDLEKKNHDSGEGDVDNDITEKRFQELKVLASMTEERILKAERTVAWLKERKATKQRKIAAARLS